MAETQYKVTIQRTGTYEYLVEAHSDSEAEQVALELAMDSGPEEAPRSLEEFDILEVEEAEEI